MDLNAKIGSLEGNKTLEAKEANGKGLHLVPCPWNAAGGIKSHPHSLVALPRSRLVRLESRLVEIFWFLGIKWCTLSDLLVYRNHMMYAERESAAQVSYFDTLELILLMVVAFIVMRQAIISSSMLG